MTSKQIKSYLNFYARNLENTVNNRFVQKQQCEQVYVCA